MKNLAKARFGKTNGAWKGGRYKDKHGYFYLQFKGKRIFEHRFKMQESIGRKLRKYEVVHHINHDPSDNRLSNLKLCTKRTHRKEHRLIDKWTKKHTRCVNCGTDKRKHASKGRCINCEMNRRVAKSRGYKCEYEKGKRIFSTAHRKALSIAMMGNRNGVPL